MMSLKSVKKKKIRKWSSASEENMLFKRYDEHKKFHFLIPLISGSERLGTGPPKLMQ